ncbi:YeiH family protein [Clostridium sp. LP20]|uniref:YeiH family protein n=1 Tax=Clostridium sp. LP20 TaxID=3418665 RepID=UPI003EE7D635
MKKIKDIIPGFVICLLIALVGKWLALIFPSLGAATFAIILGIIAGNTIFNKEVYDKGSKFSESELLAYSIVLMGATLNLSDVGSVGVKGVLFIVLQMSLTIIATYIIGRKLKFNKKFSLLMCAGNSVCGSSAVGAVAPVVHADSKDKGISITMVNVTGTFLMFILPLIAGLIYNHETTKTSALMGGILQSVGQVIASAKFVNDSVVEMATIFKIIRIIFIVGVVLIFSKLNCKENEGLFKKDKNVANNKVKVRVPWYIIGFFIFSIINSFGLIPESLSDLAHFISGQFEIIALAAIGMRVKFRDLMDEGPKAMLYGTLVGISQIIFALILIKTLIA